MTARHRADRSPLVPAAFLAGACAAGAVGARFGNVPLSVLAFAGTCLLPLGMAALNRAALRDRRDEQAAREMPRT